MFTQDYIICINTTHEGIMLDFLGDIQRIIDNATEKDEDYDSFLSVLTNIIMQHNDNGELAYKDTIFRNNWLYSLPSMVYWASIGYISALEGGREDIPSIASKLAGRLSKVNESISLMVLYSSDLGDNNTMLN